MSTIKSRIKKARPYSGNRFQPLTCRAEREFFELTGTPIADVEKSTSIKAPANTNRKLVTAGMGMLSVIIFALIAVIASPAPMAAFAATPHPLQFSPLVITSQDLLTSLAALANNSTPLILTDRIRVQTWSLAITDYGDQSELVGTIVPEQYDIKLNPDGSLATEVRAGRPIDPAGNLILGAVAVPPAGTLLWRETFPADRNLFSGPFPTIVHDVELFLQQGMLQDTEPNSASYLRAIVQLMMARNLSLTETATILEFLAALPDVQVAGLVNDRLGRQGVAISASQVLYGNEVTEYLIFSPINGQIIAAETVHKNGLIPGQIGPIVTEYYAWER